MWNSHQSVTQGCASRRRPEAGLSRPLRCRRPRRWSYVDWWRWPSATPWPEEWRTIDVELNKDFLRGLLDSHQGGRLAGGVPELEGRVHRHSVSKVEKRFLAVGFPIFLGRWSDQTFFESSIKTKTENICSCWIFVKTKDLSKIFVKNVPSEVWIGYKTQFLKKIWWCLPQGADSFSLL